MKSTEMKSKTSFWGAGMRFRAKHQFPFLLMMVCLSLFSFLQANAADQAGQGEAENMSTTGNTSTTPDVKGSDTRSGKSYMVRLDSFFLLLGEANIDFQWKVNDQLSVGPMIGLMPQGSGIFYGTKVANRLFFDEKTKRQSVGLKATYFFKSFHRHSPYLSFLAKQGKSEITAEGKSSSFFSGEKQSGEFTEKTFSLIGGYQWNWRWLSVNVGGGLAHYDHPQSFQYKRPDGSTFDFELEPSGVGYFIDSGVGFRF